MDLRKLVVAAGSILLPPDLEDDVDARTPQEVEEKRRRFRLRMLRWRLVVSVALIALLSVSGRDHWAGDGFNFGAGVAYAGDVDQKIAASEARGAQQMAVVTGRLSEIEKKLDEEREVRRQDRADALDAKLKGLQSEWCKTTVRELKLVLNEKIEEEMRKYRRIASEDYRPRSCEVL